MWMYIYIYIIHYIIILYDILPFSLGSPHLPPATCPLEKASSSRKELKRNENATRKRNAACKCEDDTKRNVSERNRKETPGFQYFQETNRSSRRSPDVEPADGAQIT